MVMPENAHKCHYVTGFATAAYQKLKAFRLGSFRYTVTI